jgi:hypothetical protein
MTERKRYIIKINLPLKDRWWHRYHVDDGVYTRGREEKEENPKNKPDYLCNKRDNTLFEGR